MFGWGLKRLASLLKPGWTPEEGLLGAPEPDFRGTSLNKSQITFQVVQHATFIDVSNGIHFLKDVLYENENTTFDVSQRETFSIPLQTFLIHHPTSTFGTDLLRTNTGVTSCRCLKVL